MNDKRLIFISGVTSIFRKWMKDPELTESVVTEILRQLDYPFGRYTNREGKHMYDRFIIDGYFSTKQGREKIEKIIETLKYNKITSDEIRQRQDDYVKKHKHFPSQEDVNIKYIEAVNDRNKKYKEYIENFPPETSMRYVSNQLLKNDDVVYENFAVDDILFNNRWKFITYGSDNFDLQKFQKPFQDEDYMWLQKCKGGLWACPISTIYNWRIWCEENMFKDDSLDKHFIFTLDDNANIYVIDNLKDLDEISTVTSKYGIKCIDYNKLFDMGYDGIFVTQNGVRMQDSYIGNDGKYIEGLSTFDIESLCVFNPDVIIPIDVLTESLSDTKTSWKPEDGLFTRKSPSYIANYLLKHSENAGQAIKRLTFYMNRAGENLTNKAVLNKAKKILQGKLEESANDTEPDIQEAIDAVIKAGLLKQNQIDRQKSHILSYLDFPIGIVSGGLSRTEYMYSFDKHQLISTSPMIEEKIYKNCMEIFFSNRVVNNRNIITKDGLLLKKPADKIFHINDNVFLVKYNYEDMLVTIDGRFLKCYDIKPILNERFFYCDFGKNDSINFIVDSNMKTIIDNISNYESYTSRWKNGEEIVEEPMIVTYNDQDQIVLFDKNMKVIFEDVTDIQEKPSDRDKDLQTVVVEIMDNSYNMVGRNYKPLFEKSVKSIDYDFVNGVGWFAKATRFDNEKSCIIKNDTLEILFNDWFDEIVDLSETDEKILGCNDVVALNKNGKCQLICLDRYDNYNFLHYLIKDWVDDIHVVGEDSDIIIVKKEGKNYIAWLDKRLFNINPKNIYIHKLYLNKIIVIKTDNDKIDILSSLEPNSFCEKWLNGRKLDAIFDYTSDYPIMELNKKYSYININVFRPEFFDTKNGKIIWFDDCELAEYDETTDESTFKVVENGQKKSLKA